MVDRREHCVLCGRHESECGKLSLRHRCEECGIRAHIEHNTRLQESAWMRFLEYIQIENPGGVPPTT